MEHLRLLTAGRNVEQLCVDHPIHTNQKLGRQSRHQLSHKHSRPGLRCNTGIVFLLDLGIDVGIVRHFSSLIEAIKYFDYL